jgi:uncharacterized small protein (DUF1192 family)
MGFRFAVQKRRITGTDGKKKLVAMLKTVGLRIQELEERDAKIAEEIARVRATLAGKNEIAAMEEWLGELRV